MDGREYIAHGANIEDFSTHIGGSYMMGDFIQKTAALVMQYI